MTIRASTKRINKSRIVMDKYSKQIERIIVKGANDVRNTAVKNINSHSSSGRTYGRHTASEPYSYPNTDTGYLANNIFVEIDNNKMAADVESRAEYSEYLEFGTSKMLPRPFMQPALEENRRAIIKLFARLKARGV